MFNEANTVETFIRDLLCGGVTDAIEAEPGFARIGSKIAGLGWTFLPKEHLPRQVNDVFVESFIRDALFRLNPEIAEKPDRADEVLYKLRAIVLAVRSDGIIKANEEFTAWMRGDRSMPFGPNNEHVTVRLIDFDNPENNQYVVTTQYSYQAGPANRRADMMLLVNGLPLVLIEAKTPVRQAISWVDGAIQVHDDYEKYVPELFACNVFSAATEGKELFYGSIRMPIELWGPWRPEDAPASGGLIDIKDSVRSLFRPTVLLDILANFTLFATDKKKRRLKIVCRYQQYEAANKIVARVLAGHPKKGLIWHFQGSGKSLLMVFAAQKLRMQPALKNPAVLIVIDRIDLDSQISATFHASDIPNLVQVKTRAELRRALRQDTRKILITTIFKFGEETLAQKANRLLKDANKLFKKRDYKEVWQIIVEVEAITAKLDKDQQSKLKKKLASLMSKLDEAGNPRPSGLTIPVVVEDDDEDNEVLNERENIIVLVDEAHRTQEGDLGLKMRAALPNAFLFGLTGTPINKRDRNTYYAFGAEEDERGYISRYGFEESIRDGATLPLHFEPRLMELHIDKEAIDREYAELTGGISDLDRDNLARAASKMAVLVKVPERIEKICADIAQHFRSKVEPNGFKAMVVTFDQECCLLYRDHLQQHLDPEEIDIVISATGKDERYKPYDRSKDAEEKLLDRFRDSNDPLNVLIVTAKLLTGFDAPILQAMYLDKPMKDHTLLQAICRTNRKYGDMKTHGLIVDYLGVFDDVAKSLEFDEKGFRSVVSNIEALKDKLPGAMQKCLGYFPGVDRTLTGYEGLILAQECLPNNEVRDNFAADYSYLQKLWEAISPDTILSQYETDYRWLAQVYQSVQPTSGTGQLIWHSLGAKTIELIHRNVHVDAVRDDLDEIVLDAELLEAVMGAPDPRKKAKEIEFKLTRRLRQRMGDPKFKKLSERLESLKERHEQGQLQSVEFLKALLDLAKDLLEAEKDAPPVQDEDRGKAALTELFEEAKNDHTPVMVERVVNDIDEIVRMVRFPGWQQTSAGEREVKKALRKTLFKYKLHQDAELFEKAYGYIRQYY